MVKRDVEDPDCGNESASDRADLVELDTSSGIWPRFFTVAPLVVIGTKEGDSYDMAPKHMAMPLGKDNIFGFVCTPRHSTYHNAIREGEFTVSYPRPSKVLFASLTAIGRIGPSQPKRVLDELPLLRAQNVDALLLQDSYLFLECTLARVIDGFGDYSLVTGDVVSARVHADSFRDTDGDDQKLIYEAPLLAYIADGRIATVSDTVAFPFAKSFHY